jgi:hypothetical protein
LTEGRIYVGDAIRVAAAAELVLGTINPEKARQCELGLAGLDLNVRTQSLMCLNECRSGTHVESQLS